MKIVNDLILKYNKKMILILGFTAIVSAVVGLLVSIVSMVQLFGYVPWGWVYVVQHLPKLLLFSPYILLVGSLSCLALLYIKKRSLFWGFLMMGPTGLLVVSIVALRFKSKQNRISFSERNNFQKIGIVFLYFLLIIHLLGGFLPMVKVMDFMSQVMSNGSYHDSFSIEDELSKVKSDYALILPTQGVDGYPVWSDDGRFIYALNEDSWLRVDLNKVYLSPGTWRGGSPIGVNASISSVQSAPESQEAINMLVSKQQYDEQYVTLSNGTKVGFEEPGMYSRFVIIKPGEKPKTLWETEGELCYYLMVSPNKKYLLFKCELNGVILMNLENYQK